MLHKLLKIKGVGKFWDYSPVCFQCWNGVFEQSNAIYADNGSGKTTFTQILKSASGVDSQLLGKRRSFGYTDLISVIFLDGHNKEIKFDGNTWMEKTVQTDPLRIVQIDPRFL